MYNILESLGYNVLSESHFTGSNDIPCCNWLAQVIYIYIQVDIALYH